MTMTVGIWPLSPTCRINTRHESIHGHDGGYGGLFAALVDQFLEDTLISLGLRRLIFKLKQ